jgi:hypothetical protein
MTNQWQGGETFVSRMRVRGRGLDPTLTRLRLAALLSSAHLAPAGLAPSAILCVRHLRGPTPGSLSTRAGGGLLPPDWEQAVASSLGELARRAARPVRDAVPASAEAVLFTDQAELLACLVSDYCDGVAAACWWWTSLFHGADVSPVRALLDAPACIPATFEHLARRGKTVAFARTLGAGETLSLLLSVTRVFALQYLQESLDAAFNSERRARDEGDEEAVRDSLAWTPDAFPQAGRVAAQTLEGAGTQTAPWHRAVPEGAGLTPEQQTLLGVGLMLSRELTFVRTRAFARATRRWLFNASATCDGVRIIPPTRLLAERTAARHSPATQTVAREESIAVALFNEPPDNLASSKTETGVGIEGFYAAGFETAQHLEELSVQAPGDARVLSETVHASLFQNTESEVESSRTGFVEDEYVERQATSQWLEKNATGCEAADTMCVQEAGMETRRMHTACVETKLGGIFYLLNLALFLELYGDFTKPAAPGIPLSPWDFLALAGAELAGENFYADPLCELLALLAGRGEGDAPGAGFVPPDEWRMPAAWLDSFTEHVELSWTLCEGRLRVRHPEGFFLLDLPVKLTDVRARLTDEMQAYKTLLSCELRHEKVADLSHDMSETNGIKLWLTRLMPYVRARLQRAFGLSVATHLSSILCEQPARVLASVTHVDVFFSLAALPVEVRLSGIDRDPGWMPAAGRFIAFHYE